MGKKRIIILGGIILIAILAIVLLVLSNNSYQVKFDCGKGCKIETQYIKKNKKVVTPQTPKRKGYVFVEWQLNGKKYSFNSKVTKDITLKAKWLTEKYITVTLDMNNGEDTKTVNVLAGTSISSNIEKPVKENYTFDGWYVNDIKYDLNKLVTSNIKLTAKWKLDISSLAIGDTVRIIGSYAESSLSLNAFHSTAIGWERKVINIYEGTEFPYAIGNSYGITGYFKSSSLEKVN